MFYKNGRFQVKDQAASIESLKVLHQTIKKVTQDIERLSFNTCVSSFMICVNQLNNLKCSSNTILEPLLVLLSPFAPHIAEELWMRLGHSKSIAFEPFPKFDPSYLEEKVKEYPISFNGKKRFTITLPLELNVEQIKEEVMSDKKTLSQLAGNSPKKIIVVPGKIINIVI